MVLMFGYSKKSVRMLYCYIVILLYCYIYYTVTLQFPLTRLRLICHAGLSIPLWLRHLSRRLYVVLVSELSKTIVLLFLIVLRPIPDISSCDIASIWHFMSLPQRIYVLSCWLSCIFCVNILISKSCPNDDRYSDIESFTTLAFSFLNFSSHSFMWAKNGSTS